ncbi:conserved hypothetical protein [Talaromyces stipitatus ATCC 10500]|uniref:Uncharacterized protein n=1 Tax=Talaromyces stipitatus (strain ATCC 10500 / CBS 375.48 / QM 6759 / NRRL 1006) TaxID=441959 RepID=B8MQZ7_TALSN|nr:uncharacterized protein TSTA_053500 [Talaromyces stipitatus ATCC 10500]EED12832.1 conserved hypothetical protein [Talaromyces stipitatus ATCC 10500]
MDGTRSASSEDASDAGTVLKNIDVHHSSLSSHLRLIKSLQPDVGADTVSQILDSAQKLVDQFTALQKQLASSGIGTSTENPKPKTKTPRIPKKTNGISGMEKAKSADSTGVSAQGGAGKKRSWDNDLSEGQESSIDYTDNQSSRKRPRTKRKMPGDSDAVEDFVPVALEKDDISEEVEQRLRLKQERRKKLSAEPEKKRKRDSIESNNGDRWKRSRE